MMTYIIVLFGVFALCLVLSSFFVRVEKAIRSAPDGSRPRATMLEPLSEAEGKPFLEEEGWSAVRTIDESLSTRVYEAVTGNGETVAVKQVHLPSLRASVERRWYYSQGNFNLETPQTQEHHCLFGFIQEETVDIWYEYIRGYSIRELYLDVKFDKRKIPTYTRQILEALKYLHKNNVIHLDVSCCNMLLDEKDIVKLAGFHFAQEIEGNMTVPREKDLDDWVRWTAPEVMLPKEPHCGPASDIWGLGCAVYEIATSAFPYSNMPWLYAIMEISEGRMPIMPDTLSNDCRDFIEKCLQFNPSDRPTASQLFLHPFIAHAKTI